MASPALTASRSVSLDQPGRHTSRELSRIELPRLDLGEDQPGGVRLGGGRAAVGAPPVAFEVLRPSDAALDGSHPHGPRSAVGKMAVNARATDQQCPLISNNGPIV